MELICYERPPNWDDVVSVFPFAARRGVMFAYDGRIYSPSGVTPSADLVAHERVHHKQQGDHSESWWKQYLSDPEFRLTQEVWAYRAQLMFARDYYGREHRREIERHIVKALSSPLYGSLVTPKQAKGLLGL